MVKIPFSILISFLILWALSHYSYCAWGQYWDSFDGWLVYIFPLIFYGRKGVSFVLGIVHKRVNYSFGVFDNLHSLVVFDFRIQASNFSDDIVEAVNTENEVVIFFDIADTAIFVVGIVISSADTVIFAVDIVVVDNGIIIIYLVPDNSFVDL